MENWQVIDSMCATFTLARITVSDGHSRLNEWETRIRKIFTRFSGKIVRGSTVYSRRICHTHCTLYGVEYMFCRSRLFVDRNSIRTSVQTDQFNFTGRQLNLFPQQNTRCFLVYPIRKQFRSNLTSVDLWALTYVFNLLASKNEPYALAFS